jgi:hypothetical protein
MKITAQRWRVRNRRRLVAAVMQKLAGNARISFEGALRDSALFSIPGASEQETASSQEKHDMAKTGFCDSATGVVF